MHTRRGTAYGLDSERDQHWWFRAACKEDPDLFFAPDGPGYWNPGGALHICRFHCPVLAECNAYGEAEAPHDRTGMVLGGVAYNSRGEVADRNKADATCHRCPPEKRPPEPELIEPVAHGRKSAVRWHQAIGQALCPTCRHSERNRERQRLKRRAERAAAKQRINELIRERFLAPPPAPVEPPHPYALVLERQRVLAEALADGARDPVSHRAPKAVSRAAVMD